MHATFGDRPSFLWPSLADVYVYPTVLLSVCLSLSFCLSIFLFPQHFLDVSTHVFQKLCMSVGPSVGPSVRPTIRQLVRNTLSKKISSFTREYLRMKTFQIGGYFRWSVCPSVCFLVRVRLSGFRPILVENEAKSSYNRNY